MFVLGRKFLVLLLCTALLNLFNPVAWCNYFGQTGSPCLLLCVAFLQLVRSFSMRTQYRYGMELVFVTLLFQVFLGRGFSDLLAFLLLLALCAFQPLA